MVVAPLFAIKRIGSHSTFTRFFQGFGGPGANLAAFRPLPVALGVGAAAEPAGRPRQTIVDFKGATKKGTKLHDQMIFKMYHSTDWLTLPPDGTHTYFDDLEIWSDFSSGC